MNSFLQIDLHSKECHCCRFLWWNLWQDHQLSSAAWLHQRNPFAEDEEHEDVFTRHQAPWTAQGGLRWPWSLRNRSQSLEDPSSAASRCQPWPLSVSDLLLSSDWDPQAREQSTWPLQERGSVGFWASSSGVVWCHHRLLQCSVVQWKHLVVTQRAPH